MSDSNANTLLAKLADIFRQEGDPETADALDRQLQAALTPTLTEFDVERVRRLRRQWLHLDSRQE